MATQTNQKLYRLHFDNGEFMVLNARDIPEARRLAYIAALRALAT